MRLFRASTTRIRPKPSTELSRSTTQQPNTYARTNAWRTHIHRPSAAVMTRSGQTAPELFIHKRFGPRMRSILSSTGPCGSRTTPTSSRARIRLAWHSESRGMSYTLMSPYPTLDSPISLQSWGRQLKLDNAADARIDQFVSALRVNPNTYPEVGATCSVAGDELRPEQPAALRPHHSGSVISHNRSGAVASQQAPLRGVDTYLPRERRSSSTARRMVSRARLRSPA